MAFISCKNRVIYYLFSGLSPLRWCLQMWVRYVLLSSLLFNIFYHSNFPGFLNSSLLWNFFLLMLLHLQWSMTVCFNFKIVSQVFLILVSFDVSNSQFLYNILSNHRQILELQGRSWFVPYVLNFTESDLIPGIGTFVACLVLPLEIGILVGIGINILFILYHAARPKIAIENQTVSIIAHFM